jgi:hypothetical protein
MLMKMEDGTWVLKQDPHPMIVVSTWLVEALKDDQDVHYVRNTELIKAITDVYVLGTQQGETK